MYEFKCNYCGDLKKNKNSLTQHSLRCKSNPNRISTYTENWNDEKKLKHSEIMKTKNNNKNRVLSPTTIERLKIISKENNLNYWTDENKKIQSLRMKEVVKNNPKSYSSNNVCGRTKITKYNGFSLNGSWELKVAKWLDKNNIKWTNVIENPFKYFWENIERSYFPDFYLYELDIYIEVKGYCRPIDLVKWSVVNNLIVIKKSEIKLIDNDKYELSIK